MINKSSAYTQQPIRSYVLRQGRLTRAQQYALDHYWEQYGIDFSHTRLNFDALFNNEAPVTLEIGFGNGDSLLEQALRQPGHNFIGIEVHRPGVGRLLQQIHNHDLKNIRVISHDAVEVLDQQIPDHSISCLQLFFPDPWQKKRHHKRRIIQSSFLNHIYRSLKVKGIFHLATDWQDYADYMIETLDKFPGFKNKHGNGNFSETRNNRPLTKFEQRGIKLGHPVRDLIYIKTG